MIRDRIQTWQPAILQLILLLLLLQLAVTLLTDGFVLSFDEAMWHYIGRNWFRNGLTPYTGGADNKSPLIFAIFGLSDKLFGVNYWFPRVLGTLCQSISVFYIYKIAKHIADHKTGILAASIYGLSLLWHGTGGKYVSYTETYEMLFIILAFYRFLTAGKRKDILISGIFAGIAIAFRLTAVFAVAAILIGCLRKNRSFIFPFFAGILSALGCLLLISFLAGINISAMFNYMVSDNFASGSATDHSFAWKLHNMAGKFIWSPMLLFYPLLLGYIFIKRNADLFVLWLILAFAGICAVGIFDVVHLKELLPALSLISAFFVAYLVDRCKWPSLLVALVAWIIFFPNLSEALRNYNKAFLYDIPDETQYCSPPYTIPGEGARKKLGQWVRDNTSEKDMVYVAGFGAQVQVYTERISPTIYFNVTQTPIAKARLYHDLQLNKPAMILVPLFPEYKQQVGQDIRDFVDSVVSKSYLLQNCMYNYNIYTIRR